MYEAASICAHEIKLTQIFLSFRTDLFSGRLTLKDQLKYYRKKEWVFVFWLGLDLCCCVWVFSSCNEQGLSFAVVPRLLIAVASPVAEHRLQACGPQYLQHLDSAVAAPGPSSAGSVVVATGLAAPQQVESSRTRDQIGVPCIGRLILIHCATREVQAQDLMLSMPNCFPQCLCLSSYMLLYPSILCYTLIMY